MKFGEKLREARIARGLSQKELAKRTGIAVRTIINYARLAEVLDVDVDSLKDDNADFIIKASEKYGSRAKRQAEKIIRDVQAIYAGGELEERDMDAMMKALQDAYWAAKEINRKYVPKKYREEEGE